MSHTAECSSKALPASRKALEIGCSLCHIPCSQLYNLVQSAKCLLFSSLCMTLVTVTSLQQFKTPELNCPYCHNHAARSSLCYLALSTAPQYVTAAVSGMRPLLLKGGVCMLSTPPILVYPTLVPLFVTAPFASCRSFWVLWQACYFVLLRTMTKRK